MAQFVILPLCSLFKKAHMVREPLKTLHRKVSQGLYPPLPFMALSHPFTEQPC
jgi:hypothetical protein